MKTLKQLIIETIGKPKKPFFVMYSGRFQPPTQNHYNVYKYLTKTFGKQNVFIGTSSKKEPGRSPFNLKEKIKIWSTMFKIPEKTIVWTMFPYRPETWHDKFLKKLSDDTVYISAIGEKDLERQEANPYFEEYDPNKDLKGWKEKGYYYIVPLQKSGFGGKMISGTSVRNVFKSNDQEAKRELFVQMYGKMDEEIFNLLDEKII